MNCLKFVFQGESLSMLLYIVVDKDNRQKYLVLDVNTLLFMCYM